MAVLFIVLPLAIVMAGIALAAFFISARHGQFDDLDTPPQRMLFSEVPVSPAPPAQTKP
ncbi:MAG TPA: cbb3-type cytochrome oxidase assembly protein CcoS [Tepidisphaeraceae bacterium]|jgi:cbb3-type cytochrome oxidase maturation protein|nr:cbb3-type cytochrome oxidase assembly protein CcoS [Tepidisphaeraceae bacterium]